MKQSIIDKIKSLVEESGGLPNATIEYNFELPNIKGITKTNFLGVNAFYNSMVSKGDARLIYKLS